MSMLQRFFVFLEELLRNNDGPVEPEALKAEMEANGFAEVTSGDVLDAVTLMCGEGNVFDASQVQALRAYTGGNSVDQGFGGASVASHQVSAPQPPPMDPKEGYTNLDAAVEHISYVSNVTNNTTINDQDTFEDNDTIVDNSVDQTIIADGDVYQDIDNATATDGGVANTGLIEDSTLVTGENDGIIADDVEDSVLVTGDVGGSVARDVEDSNYAGGDNSGIMSGDGSTSIQGDGNTVQNFTGSDGNIVTDGPAVVGSQVGAVTMGDGEANAMIGSAGANANFGEGDVSSATVQSADGAAVQIGTQDSNLTATNVEVGGDYAGRDLNDIDLTNVDESQESNVNVTDNVVNSRLGDETMIEDSNVGPDVQDNDFIEG